MKIYFAAPGDARPYFRSRETGEPFHWPKVDQMEIPNVLCSYVYSSEEGDRIQAESQRKWRGTLWGLIEGVRKDLENENATVPAVPGKIEFHEVSLIFPDMEEGEFKELKESIRANELQEPIVLHEGKIIDGRHRYKACLELGIEPHFCQWNGKGSLVQFVVDSNLHRRHLNTSQRATLTLKIIPFLKVEAKSRQGRRMDLPNIQEKFPGCSFRQARDMAAKIVCGTNSHYVTDAARILKEDSRAFELIVQGKANIPTAKRFLGFPVERRTEIYERVNNNGTRLVDVLRDLAIKDRKENPVDHYKKALEELQLWFQKYAEIDFPNKTDFREVAVAIEALVCKQDSERDSEIERGLIEDP